MNEIMIAEYPVKVIDEETCEVSTKFWLYSSGTFP
jgi:hypothetical protein